MGKPTVIIARHGATKYDPPVAKKDRIAGHEDLRLAPEGKAEAQRMASSFAKQPIAKVWTSNLSRADETARIIAKGHPNQPIVMPTVSLRPQHVGELTHQLEEDVRPDLLFYQTEAPTRAIPGGESFEQFTNRLLPFLQERFAAAQKRGTTELIVTHSRNFPVIDGWMAAGMKGADVDPGPIKSEAEIPAGHAVVFRYNGDTWDKSTMKAA